MLVIPFYKNCLRLSFSYIINDQFRDDFLILIINNVTYLRLLKLLFIKLINFVPLHICYFLIFFIKSQDLILLYCFIGLEKFVLLAKQIHHYYLYFVYLPYWIKYIYDFYLSLNFHIFHKVSFSINNKNHVCLLYHIF
jgi:hypothetical protein